MDPVIHTFGCKVNSYDSGLIEKWLKDSAGKHSGSRVHVLNTCAVTQEATKEALKVIRRIKAQDPFSTIVVTGCGAQVDTDAFSDLPGADLVVANSHKSKIQFFLEEFFKGNLKEKVIKSNIFRKEDLEMGGGQYSKTTRSFLKIQDGCNSFCSYCIIPYARGKSRSVPVNEIVNRVQLLGVEGVREVVLTGIHIGDFDDQGTSLSGLVSQLLEKTSNMRFRLSSLEPLEVSRELLSMYQDPRMCPHFHMSIQSAQDQVLKGMKRNYGEADVRCALEQIQKFVPQAFVGMDVIVGFPNETEDCFNETKLALEQSPWTKIHVFPYSPRNGTRAATWMGTARDCVSASQKRERSTILRRMSLERYQLMAERQVGSKKQALVLQKKGRGANAISEDNWSIQIQGSESFLEGWKGEILPVQVVGYSKGTSTLGEGVLEASLDMEGQP